MRVLFWSDVFWPTIGGTEVLSLRLIHSLRRRGHEFLVVASNAELDLPDEDWCEGIPIRRFPFAASPTAGGLQRFVAIRQGVARVRREFGPELVHLACIAPGAMFQLESNRVERTPLLVTVQQSTSLFQTDGARGLLTSLLRAADWVACCSEPMRAEVQTMVPEIASRSSAVVNALEPPGVAPAPPPERPTLLCIGRLAPQKGFDVALAAFASVASRFGDAQLVIVGDGPDRSGLEAMARRLGVADRVMFRGWLAPELVFAEINRSTLVLMPSRHEPFGLVALEAAFMERPVVATRVGGLCEVVLDGETGRVVPPEDSGALAEAITHLLEHRDAARRLGRAARSRALGIYSWDRYVGAYDALYRNFRREIRHAGSE